MKGIYLLEGKKIGTIDKFNPDDWYGYVTLDAMPQFAEFGTLDPDTEVDVDGTIYKPPERYR